MIYTNQNIGGEGRKVTGAFKIPVTRYSSWAIRNLSVALVYCYPLLSKAKLTNVTSFLNFLKNYLVGSLCIKDAQVFV